MIKREMTVEDYKVMVQQLERSISELHQELDNVHNMLAKTLDITQTHTILSKYLKLNGIPGKLPKGQNLVQEFVNLLTMAVPSQPDDVLCE